jgi:hypothetical protein
LRKLYPHNDIIDEEEEDWVEHLNVARSRGKSTPKKKRTAAGRSRPITFDGLLVLTIDRIEEVQQAKVSGSIAATRSIERGVNKQLARWCISIVNEALDGVTLGLAQICTCVK